MRFALACVVVFACSSAPDPDTIAFELDAPLAGDTYWQLPFPSDLRTTAAGTPDLAGFPNPRELPILADLLSVAAERRGFPTQPIAWFQFTGEPPAHALDEVLVGDAAPALLVDIDPTSDERGSLHAIIAQTLPEDRFTGSGLVALAPRPGIVLRGGTRYAYVLRKAFAPGVARPPAFDTLARGGTPAGARGAAARELYAPLWETLDAIGIERDDVLVATVFTTGDEIALLRARSEAVRAAYDATIADLHVDAVDGATHPDFCELVGTVTVPQFQRGEPPFTTEGRFVLDGDGVPVAQSTATIPLAITIPKRTMPAGGWPLWQYFHGSGGASFDIVDEGPTLVADGMPVAGQGPGSVVAKHGIAAASSALPVNPERLPGASNYAYLEINNLAAFPYTFQQGVFEQRLLLDALLALEIPPATLAACSGVSLPAGETAHHFNPATLTAGGHSMGGMYTNMIGAVEPRYGALTPFGAGGFWNMMILDTEIQPGARDLLAGVFGIDPETLSFVHPTLALLGLGWEIAEPGASMNRIASRPLPGIPPRHIYEPIGLDDKFFPNPVFDAAALAYGNQQAGELVWPSTQDALRVDALDGMLAYPVRGNRDGLTTVAVQYADDGIVDAHQIYRQLDAVKYQYGCFLASYLRDGTPTVPAPMALGTPCP
ncbi:MAG TPA: hypothetical protein VFQ53_07990 [Kofleriaceae bacterium]|nr:hypothetical protein [Kofleriaceae bacterium]